MIFQDPLSSLNPVVPIGIQVTEVLERHRGQGPQGGAAEARDLLDAVGIPDPAAAAQGYPHQISGGMRQRALIAMALACKPRLLIADEPTTALDVTIQAQILTLLKELVDDTGTALIMITHDLGVVAGLCDEVNVLYGGRWSRRPSGTSCSPGPGTRTRTGCCSSIPRLDAVRGERLHADPRVGLRQHPLGRRLRLRAAVRHRRCRRTPCSRSGTRRRCAATTRPSHRVAAAMSNPAEHVSRPDAPDCTRRATARS